MIDRRHLMSELRRRHVFRAVVAYWVVAWTGIEVSSLVEQALMLPDWLDRTVVILAIAGLPVVAVCAWVFEWETCGLVLDDATRRHSDVAEHEREREIARRIASEVYSRLSREFRNVKNFSAHLD